MEQRQVESREQVRKRSNQRAVLALSCPPHVIAVLSIWTRCQVATRCTVTVVC